MYKIGPKMLCQVRIKPIGSFSFILVLYILFLLFYIILMPAFEGADEPDHLRYIEAIFEAKKIHPVDRSAPRRYGIEVYHPPLYYHIAALTARFFPVVFPDHLAINPDKNPNRPFLVHDDPGEIFPFDSPRKTLRLFRTLSLLFGIAAFVIFARILRLAMAENPQGTRILLLIAALWPNNLQIFSVASNDALVFMLSLGLILAVLNCIRADRPSWKQGLLVGTIFALALLTKMTILLTAAALFPVLVFDSILDRRRSKLYLKMLPAVLLPVLLLAGPFLISGIIWYGSPTREGLLKILTPSLVRPSPLSFDTTVSAMAKIFPGRFLADLCWQHLTLPFASLQFFVIWFFLNVLMGVRMAFVRSREQSREHALHMMLALSSFVFMFVGLYRISIHWTGMQLRHVWNLWPFTLLAMHFAMSGLKFLRRVNKERILSIIFAGLMLILVPVNFLILYNYILMYKPVEEVSSPDLDYVTFTDHYAQSSFKASAYVDTTGSSDIIAYRHFAQRHDWKNALFHACRAIEKGADERESRLMCARSLRLLGKPNKALDVLNKAVVDFPEAQLLEISLLIDIRRFHDAGERIRRLLPEAPPNVRVQLESMLKKISTKARDNRTGPNTE